METWPPANRHLDLIGLAAPCPSRLFKSGSMCSKIRIFRTALPGWVLVRLTVLSLAARAFVSTACAPGLAPKRKRRRQLSVKSRSCSQRSFFHQRKVNSAGLPMSPVDTCSPVLAYSYVFPGVQNEVRPGKEDPISIFSISSLQRGSREGRTFVSFQCFFLILSTFFNSPHTEIYLPLP